MAMTRTELDLAARLLDMAADKYAGHVCNDFVMDASAEHHAILVAMHEADDDPDKGSPPEPGDRYTQDWLLMMYLAGRLREEAGDGVATGVEE